MSQLHNILENNNILIHEQFFFLRAKHYTQQLLCVVGFICENLNKNIPAVAIFFDVAKAFAKI